MLKEIFTSLIDKYTSDSAIAQKLWDEIEKQYTSPKRFYHNLQHLENMYKQLEACEQIDDWDTLMFSLFYHDIIYKATSKDNEEKSALAAIKALTAINYPKEKIKLCGEQILATKGHELSTDNDTNLFTDADLSILGSDWDSYLEYSKQVRNEYAIYPDLCTTPAEKRHCSTLLRWRKFSRPLSFHKSLKSRHVLI